MNQSSIKGRFNLISALLVVLVIYNAIYWGGKFFTGDVPSFISGFYNLFGKQKTVRIILAAIFTIAFGARFLIGMIDIYMGGGVR